MEDLQQEIKALKARNLRVEEDKAWETSLSRTLSISLITYLSVLLVLYVINVERPWLSAIIPVLGYLLSTQSLPFVRKLWKKGRK